MCRFCDQMAPTCGNCDPKEFEDICDPRSFPQKDRFRPPGLRAFLLELADGLPGRRPKQPVAVVASDKPARLVFVKDGMSPPNPFFRLPFVHQGALGLTHSET
jgi:hypothetical protein